VEKVETLPLDFQQKLLTFVHTLFTGKNTVCLTNKKIPQNQAIWRHLRPRFLPMARLFSLNEPSASPEAV
jgi:hypothetical protein|tara:strand:+ start:299 stop:508 length:210 start_codon:yes stop_codon:yes gene_type:complete